MREEGNLEDLNEDEKGENFEEFGSAEDCQNCPEYVEI